MKKLLFILFLLPVIARGQNDFKAKNIFRDTVDLKGVVIADLSSGVGTKAVRWDGTSKKFTVVDTTTGSGSGTVNSGTANTLAYYGSTGTAISGLAAMGNSMAMVTDGSGLPTSHGTVTATQIGYLSTLTGPVRKTGTTASSSTPSPTGDGMQNTYTITALATNPTFAAPSGTPVDQNTLLIRITDNGTSRTLAWNAIYDEGTDLPLPTATVISETMYVQFVYNSAVSKWQLIGYTGGF